MALSAMLGLWDDALGAVMRLSGRGGSNNNALGYKSPQQMITALNNPATESAAVARMHKMHYGAFYNKSSRSSFSFLAENELLRKGKGFGGAIFGRPIKGISVGMAHLSAAALFSPLQGVATSAFAPSGHKASGLVGGTARGLFYGLGDLIGTAAGGPLVGLAVGLVTEKAGGIVQEAFQMFHDLNYRIRHVNMGGDYKDTETAYTMRQRASQELGSSVMNARQWLGKEAALMHQ